jgi:trans-2,3-dihydro-3-hydroxyanthranilate isomerase
MRVAFDLVDVFAERPFEGNQLCVVTRPPAGLTEAQMLAIAREINFSETTFVTVIRDAGYDIRIFTPVEELPFAGHPTLGTAFTLVSEGMVATPVVQTSSAGDVPVDVDVTSGRARMRQLPPVFGEPFEDRASVARAAGLEPGDLIEELPIVPVSTGIAHLMVPVRDEATLRRAARGDAGCREVCATAAAESLYLFTVCAEGDVMARMFDASPTIGEDPATGSAAGPLGGYLSTHRLAGMPGAVSVSQGEMVGHPSVLRVDVAANGDSWAIDVEGGVWIVGEGSFEVPDR